MAQTDVASPALDFDSPDLWRALLELGTDPSRYDSLPYGVIAMDGSGIVLAYNQAEATFAGVPPNSVIGLDFFTDVAPCTNNYLVAGRFEEESTLDETINYVFTVKMRPTAVRLRMLKSEGVDRQYLVVKWK